MLEEKRCRGCNTIKPRAQFNKCGQSVDGLNSKCSACTSAAQRVKLDANREANASRDPYTPGATKTCFKCRQSLPVKSFMRNQSTRDGLQQMCRECARPVWRASRQKRIDSSPKHKIDGNMRSAMRATLKRGQPQTEMFAALGYSRDELVAHLKSTIPNGFTWDDYLNSTLAIDHERPRCLFLYTSKADPTFRECWALSNLRLLPHDENTAKQKEDQRLKRLAAQPEYPTFTKREQQRINRANAELEPRIDWR